MKRKILAGILALSVVAGTTVLPYDGQEVQAASVKETVVSKSTLGNPILGFDDNDQVTYAGDPAVLVDDDTVYIYVGHDTSTGSGYVMPNYLCYSSQDMEEWTYEGITMTMTDVVWGDNNSAWASQVVKYNDKYYMYYCSWNNQDSGKQSIGVAESVSPTGPFVDKGTALIKGSLTTSTSDGSNTWIDIDPTVWIEQDEDGEDRIYLAWGNTHWYVCELNQDMVSVKDSNGDGNITMNGDIWEQTITGAPATFTEAPYLYRQQDEDGNYYGQYYMFYAMNWREEMAYCTTDDILSGTWEYGGKLMPPTATSNTNHPAVFDFDGKTYFVYHNGSLPWGSGYRRSVCVEEFTINDDGTIDPIQETATGLTGRTSVINDYTNTPIAHVNFENTINDADYPITESVNTLAAAEENDTLWEIVPGKADKENEAYISIESYNKPGLYLSVEQEKLVLTQDSEAADKNGITEDSENMTFRTLEGFDGYGVTLESVAKPGYYVTSVDGELVLSKDPDPAQCTFMIENNLNLTSITARKSTKTYETGDTLVTSDIQVTAYYDDGSSQVVTGFTTNADKLDMSTAGTKKLTISYTEKGVTQTAEIEITVIAKSNTQNNNNTGNNNKNNSNTGNTNSGNNNTGNTSSGNTSTAKAVPKKNSVHTKSGIKYKVTKSAKKNGTVTVMGTTKKNPKKIKIPATVKINGYTFKVTKIAKKAFYNKKKLKTVIIGKNVKSIGKNAFKNISKKATFKVPSSRYKAVKKLLTAKTGFKKKTMKLKKVS